ncbi:hypothetical protein ACFQ05_36180 [Amycolatopsis umgeniensis]|uniref:Uncharacterized protein n=1 Tax=Amycolatopsis umgeniensis TaxID=336628 RepID=A0A841B3H5_9PSEU|nr:hypothetical protein [Amycolatopsis umgeniensis]MBB5855599.1 hypothetical protein [Amycolatopsis umgeniensis]
MSPRIPARRGPLAGVNYVFRGSGRIPEQANGAVDDFRGMVVVPVGKEMIVFGTVTDQGSISRILWALETLGMRVHSVHRVRELPRQETGGHFPNARGIGNGDLAVPGARSGEW